MSNCSKQKLSISFRKFILLIFLSLFILPLTLHSQHVYFCKDVDFLGNPENPDTEFSIPQSGGLVKLLVRLNKKVNCSSVVFDLYKVENKKEILENSLRMSVEPYLTWFYKEISFRKEGDFHVYIYDDKDKLLGVGEVRIVIK